MPHSRVIIPRYAPVKALKTTRKCHWDLILSNASVDTYDIYHTAPYHETNVKTI